jgi:hypothetical protein
MKVTLNVGSSLEKVNGKKLLNKQELLLMNTMVSM